MLRTLHIPGFSTSYKISHYITISYEVEFNQIMPRVSKSSRSKETIGVQFWYASEFDLAEDAESEAQTRKQTETCNHYLIAHQ